MKSVLSKVGISGDSQGLEHARMKLKLFSIRKKKPPLTLDQRIDKFIRNNLDTDYKTTLMNRGFDRMMYYRIKVAVNLHPFQGKHSRDWPKDDHHKDIRGHKEVDYDSGGFTWDYIWLCTKCGRVTESGFWQHDWIGSTIGWVTMDEVNEISQEYRKEVSTMKEISA